jgi:hypothetical protein
VDSEAYRALYAYMIRLRAEDLRDPPQARRLAEAARMKEEEFVARFSGLFAGNGRR